MNIAYLSLGGNQGDRRHILQQATGLLAQHAGTLVQVSSYYETKAWGITDQPDFLNICICLKTELNAIALLSTIQQIELQLGRQRDIKWGPRTIDIDILFFNNEVIDTPALQVPHPYVQDRRFVLLPLAEIAPEYMHPVLHNTVGQLLENCIDDLTVTRL